jgi:hypothetical protein
MKRYKNIQKQVDDRWINFSFQDLRIGDRFRVVGDCDDLICNEDGKSEWVVKSNPIPCEPDGNYVLDTE